VIPGLIHQGGILQLGAAFQGGAITNLSLNGMSVTNTLPVTGTFNVTNGTVYGNFTVTNAGPTNGGVLNANATIFAGAVTVAGRGVFNGGATMTTVTVANGGVFNVTLPVSVNPPGGSFTVASGGSLDLADYLYLRSPLTNFGTISLTNNSITLYNNGTANYEGGLVNQPGGSIDLWGYAGVSGNYGSDYFVNRGTVTKRLYAGVATISVVGLTNSGTLSSEIGVLQLSSVTLNSSGSLSVRLNSPADYGQIGISGNALLNGAINVGLNSTFVPVPGNSFSVVSFGSSSGIFSTVNFPSATGLTWHTNYSSTAFMVQVNGVPPQFLAVQQLGAQLIFSGTNGPGGGQYRVLSSTNVQLPLASWTAKATNTFAGDGTFRFTNNIVPSIPREFYRLQLLP
jgi:hypothetical protein